jgi:hypothetical protein
MAGCLSGLRNSAWQTRTGKKFWNSGQGCPGFLVLVGTGGFALKGKDYVTA